MAIDKIPLYIQEFYVRVVDSLAEDFFSAKELATKEHYSVRTIENYMKVLRRHGYVTRFNYRSWALGNEHTEDGYILRNDNVFGKCALRQGCRI